MLHGMTDGRAARTIPRVSSGLAAAEESDPVSYIRLSDVNRGLGQRTSAYVEGQADPYDMFASSSVDEGESEEREFVDTTGGQQKLPRAGEGPQKVFMIEDDPTLSGLGQIDSAATPQKSGTKAWVGILAAGVVGGFVGSIIAKRLRS